MHGRFFRFMHGAALATCLTSLAPAFAQNSVLVQPGTVTGSFSARVTVTGKDTQVLKVPSGRVARITDIIFGGGRSSPGLQCWVEVTCGGTSSIDVTVQGGQFHHLALNNGLGCSSGAQITAHWYQDTIPSGEYCNAAPYIVIRGYYFTVP